MHVIVGSVLEKLMKVLSSPVHFFDIDEQMNGSNKHHIVFVDPVQIFRLN